MPHRQLRTEFRFRIRAEVAPDRVIGPVDGGTLVYVAITGGTVRGSIEGVVLPGGGDWATFRDDGTIAVDARYQIQTVDGHIIDIWNTGMAHWTDATHAEVGYFATHPRFRGGDASLRHLSRQVFVGWARSDDDATEIDIFEVVGIESIDEG